MIKFNKYQVIIDLVPGNVKGELTTSLKSENFNVHILIRCFLFNLDGGHT